MFTHVDFTVLELIHVHCSSVKSFPARSSSGADFILAAPDADPRSWGNQGKAAPCAHSWGCPIVLGTIQLSQLREASRCSAHRGCASQGWRQGFAAPSMRLFHFNPYKNPGNLTMACPGCKFRPMLSAVSRVSLGRGCASTGLSSLPQTPLPSSWQPLQMDTLGVFVLFRPQKLE